MISKVLKQSFLSVYIYFVIFGFSGNFSKVVRGILTAVQMYA